MEYKTWLGTFYKINPDGIQYRWEYYREFEQGVSFCLGLLGGMATLFFIYRAIPWIILTYQKKPRTPFLTLWEVFFKRLILMLIPGLIVGLAMYIFGIYVWFPNLSDVRNCLILSAYISFFLNIIFFKVKNNPL